MSEIKSEALQRVPGEDFAVAEVIMGPEGKLIFEQGCCGRVFFSPPGDALNFYQLHVLGESSTSDRDGTTRELTVATDTVGGSFQLLAEYGRTAQAVCAEDPSYYSSVGYDFTRVVEAAVRSGKIALLSLPSDKRVEYAVHLPAPLDGQDGALIVTSPKYDFSYDFDAFVVPQDKNVPPMPLIVGNVARFRDGGTTSMTIGKTHTLYAAAPVKGGKITIDKKEAKKLSEAEIKALIEADRIPGVPKIPTRLITPFSGPVADGPKG